MKWLNLHPGRTGTVGVHTQHWAQPHSGVPMCTQGAPRAPQHPVCPPALQRGLQQPRVPCHTPSPAGPQHPGVPPSFPSPAGPPVP